MQMSQGVVPPIQDNLAPMIQSLLKREKCGGCEKSIYIGQSITECGKCLAVVHSKCFPKSNFRHVNDSFLCPNCQLETPPRYNPFKQINDLADGESDFFFDQDFSDFTGDLSEASKVLDSCNEMRAKNASSLLYYYITNNLRMSIESRVGFSMSC